MRRAGAAVGEAQRRQGWDVLQGLPALPTNSCQRTQLKRGEEGDMLIDLKNGRATLCPVLLK